jgi:hypothetical protein
MRQSESGRDYRPNGKVFVRDFGASELRRFSPYNAHFSGVDAAALRGMGTRDI